jgi:phage-related protein
MLKRIPVPVKPVVWVGDSLEVLRKFPDDVQWEMGHAIYHAQKGDKHESAKPRLGFGSGVLEMGTDYRGDTFRAVYTVRLAGRVYVCMSSRRSPSAGSRLPGSKPS